MKNQREKFSFKFVSYEKVLTKTKNPDIIKSHHQTNILLKIEKTILRFQENFSKIATQFIILIFPNFTCKTVNAVNGKK